MCAFSLKCTKTRFAEAAAKEQAARHNSSSEIGGSWFAYQCGICKAWHLSSNYLLEDYESKVEQLKELKQQISLLQKQLKEWNDIKKTPQYAALLVSERVNKEVHGYVKAIQSIRKKNRELREQRDALLTKNMKLKEQLQNFSNG